MTTDTAYNQAAAQMDGIIELVAALNCNYDRLQDLEDMDEEDMTADELEEHAALRAESGDCTDQEDARQHIQEDALSVEVRSGWYAPGSDSTPEEFAILLCTGGPAVRIRGELSEHAEPIRAWLEYQDWGTSWTEYHGENADRDALLAYAGCFYFGE